MLDEQERRELLEMAGSETLRADFRRLRETARGAQPPDLDRLLAFLTAVSRLGPPTAGRPAPKAYPRALL